MANALGLPEGFVLDQPEQSGLPAGFQLDQSQQTETQQQLSEVARAFAKQPLRTGAETAAAIGTAMAAEPIAGLVGLAATPAGSERATEVVEKIRAALTFAPDRPETQAALQSVAEFFRPLGEAMQTAEEATGEVGFQAAGPVGGAAGATLPTAALELTGLGAIRRAGRAAKTARAQTEAAETPEFIVKILDEVKPKTSIGEKIGDIKAGHEPETKTYQQIADDLKRKRTKHAAEQVLPDEEILKAADELGVVLTPGAYSTNRAFIEVEQALKSRPGSKISSMEERAIIDLGNRADELISDIGGATDKSILDLTVREDFTRTITDLENKADVTYKAVNQAIPRETRVGIGATRAYLNRTLRELGGDKKLLNPVERKLLKIVEDDQVPTYAALDRVRKDVGAGFQKASGPYKDVDQGVLKQVYKVLSEDQQGVADAFGVGADYQAARRLVSSRKDLEAAAQGLFGREVAGSILPKMSQAGTALTKGDVSKFKQLMESLPEARRSDVAATMLNDLFTAGARTKRGGIGQGFVNTFDGLNRNVGAKNELFRHLPKEARKRFDNIGRVAKGIFRSKALENTSRTARDIIAAMEDGGMFGKILSVGERLTPVPGTGTSIVGVGSSILRKTPATEAADNLITSPVFKKAIETAAARSPARAERMIQQSSVFKNWLSKISPNEAAQITAVGFIPWVTGQREE